MPDTPSQTYSILLLRLTSAGDWERALQTARDWLAVDPESLEAHLAAGQALVNLGQHSRARPHLDKVLAGKPSHSFAHRLASIACFHEKHFALADEHIARAVALQPHDAAHWYHLGWMRYQQGAFALATKHATRSLELRPENADALNLLALCEPRDGKAQRARLLRALELDPENSTVHNNLGGFYLQFYGDYVAAEESFRRALMFDPTSKVAQRNLFVVLRKRDVIYQVLTFPQTVVGWCALIVRTPNFLARFLLLAILLISGYHYLPALALGFVLLFPPLKAYEYVTLCDIRAQAGAPGARRGGAWSYRRWPFGFRCGVVAALTLVYWIAAFEPVVSYLFEPVGVYSIMALTLAIVVSVALAHGRKRFRAWSDAKRGESKIGAARGATLQPPS